MFRPTLSKFSAAALTFVCCTALAAAQTGPLGGGTQTSTSGPSAPVAQGLSEEAFTSFLRSLDPNVKVTRNNNNVYYNLNVQRGDWNFNLEVSLLSKRVLLYCRLGKPVSDVRQLSPEALVKLLEIMNKIGPSYFTYDRLENGSVRLCLNQNLDRGITLDRLKAGIDEFIKDVQDSFPAWSVLAN